MTSNSKVMFLNLKPNHPYLVLILDLIVKIEIFNEDTNEASEAKESRGM